MIKFEWDLQKAKSNKKKHGVAFEEAQSVFYDDLAIQFEDQEAMGEQRFIMLGRSNQSRTLVVVHCERGENKEILRIISARKATKSEQKFYSGVNL